MQDLRKRNAAPMDADKTKRVRTVVFLYDLMGDAHQRSAHGRLVHERCLDPCVLLFHHSLCFLHKKIAAERGKILYPRALSKILPVSLYRFQVFWKKWDVILCDFTLIIL